MKIVEEHEDYHWEKRETEKNNMTWWLFHISRSIFHKLIFVFKQARQGLNPSVAQVFKWLPCKTKCWRLQQNNDTPVSILEAEKLIQPGF